MNIISYLLNITNYCSSVSKFIRHTHLWHLAANLLWQDILQLCSLELVEHLLPLLGVAPDAQVIGGVHCQATQTHLCGKLNKRKQLVHLI